MPDTTTLLSDAQLELITRALRIRWTADGDWRSRAGLHPQRRSRRQPVPADRGPGRGRRVPHPDAGEPARRAPARRGGRPLVVRLPSRRVHRHAGLRTAPDRAGRMAGPGAAGHRRRHPRGTGRRGLGGRVGGAPGGTGAVGRTGRPAERRLPDHDPPRDPAPGGRRLGHPRPVGPPPGDLRRHRATAGQPGRRRGRPRGRRGDSCPRGRGVDDIDRPSAGGPRWPGTPAPSSGSG